eukprot:TRINITY_DN10385_c0_g1_i1.p1 TRINITY_DN10385_c0_g1~~TRINITY_DN10385_c0_g1_i1.p1  ORF type:complete len:677 (+),score=303.02 TRINITY_DN10385_c0_g1_i1:73-2031(+)
MPSKAKAEEEKARKQEELKKKAQDAAEKLYKQHERERVGNEKTDKTKREQEQVMFFAERDRLAKEKKEYQPIGSDKEYRLELALREFKKYCDWENIKNDSWLPDVMCEADIGAFLATWEAEDNAATESNQRDMNIDFELMAQAYDLIQNIYVALDKATVEKALGDAGGAKRCDHCIRMLEVVFDRVGQQLDTMTSNILQFLDKYIYQDEESTWTKCKQNKALRYGLLRDKRSRQRGMDYREIGVSIGPKDTAYLPAALGLVKERVIRVLQLNFDPLSIKALTHHPNRGTQYQTLGCVLNVEILVFPKLPQTVREWTLRNETHLAVELERQPYPPPQESTEATKPLKVSFEVPKHVVVRHMAPLIGVWNPENEVWQLEGTSDFDYSRETRTVTFATQKLACMAILQEKGFDVPYEEWSLMPLSDTEVLYSIEGRRRGEISDRELQIRIKENLCQVVSPDDPELEELRDEWYPPSTLLRLLSNCGFNFLFTDADAEFLQISQPKSPPMELRAYKDIANFCSVFAFCSSRHNAVREGIEPGITCEDPAQGLFRMSKDMRPDAEDVAFKIDPHDDSKWQTIRYTSDLCCITQCQEMADSANLKAAEGEVSHLNLYLMRSADKAQKAAVERRFDSGNLLLHEAVMEMLLLTRPLSFG